MKNFSSLFSLNLENVSKYFRQGDSLISVLEGVSFQFDVNRTYALCGVSGIGKSTILHLLAGLEFPTKGNIYYGSNDIFQFKDSKEDLLLYKIGLLFQNSYLLNEFSVIENVLLKAWLTNNLSKKSFYFAEDLLNYVGLSSKANQFPNILSGGEQQRVALARALFAKPKFLLADEPTAHLDEKSKLSILNLLLDFHKNFGIGIIVATHDPLIANKMEYRINIVNGKFFY